jgi:predicted nucleic acid-binding Zn ribbon protein
LTWWPLRTGPADREPRRVGESLEGTARRLGAPGVGVLGAIFAHWDELVGPEVAAHTRPRTFRDGVLVVEVDEPAWATQLRYLSADVLVRVRQAAGPGGVRELQIRVAADGGPQSSAAQGSSASRSVRSGRDPGTTRPGRDRDGGARRSSGDATRRPETPL